MSRKIDWEKPLSAEDRAWAEQFSVHAPLIELNDQQFGVSDAEAETLGGDNDDDEVPPYTDGTYWTKERLVTEAGARGLAIPAKANKADLVALLEADDVEAANAEVAADK